MLRKGEPFDIVSKLKSIADRTVPLQARCAVCGEPAIYTHKRGGSDADIELGAGEIYEPRCAKHFPFSPAFDAEENADTDSKQGDLFDL